MVPIKGGLSLCVKVRIDDRQATLYRIAMGLMLVKHERSAFPMCYRLEIKTNHERKMESTEGRYIKALKLECEIYTLSLKGL